MDQEWSGSMVAVVRGCAERPSPSVRCTYALSSGGWVRDARGVILCSLLGWRSEAVRALLLVSADQEHRELAVPQDIGRHTAQPEALDTRAAMGRHDNQISIGLQRRRDNLFAGMAFADHGAHDVTLLVCRQRLGAQIGVRAGMGIGSLDCIPGATGALACDRHIVRGRDRMHEDHARRGPGEVLGQPQGLFRVRRPI